MSRVGLAPVPVPEGVDVSVDGPLVVVSGPKGSLERRFPDAVTVTVSDGVATVSRHGDDRESKALHGLSRALLRNMVVGVSEGFTKELALVGVGYRANASGRSVELQVGYSHPVTVQAPEGIELETPDATKIIVRGIDKQAVGQVAADIRKVRPPEPYKGKGIRYVDEYVRRKAGKAAAGAV